VRLALLCWLRAQFAGGSPCEKEPLPALILELTRGRELGRISAMPLVISLLD
jgi:hypothetical protein